MIEQLLAQALVFGLTVAEWSVLLAALIAVVGVVYERLDKLKERRQKVTARNIATAVIEAIEEIAPRHPEAVRVVKKVVQDKATKLGVEIQLHAQLDAKGFTKRYRRLGPDDPTPDPGALGTDQWGKP